MDYERQQLLIEQNLAVFCWMSLNCYFLFLLFHWYVTEAVRLVMNTFTTDVDNGCNNDNLLHWMVSTS
jgi:uncharacterized membrane protein (GlpM family)